jgi:hypothetical protein
MIAAREKYSDVKIEYFGKASIFDVNGRTIHPDGMIVDLKRTLFSIMSRRKKVGSRLKCSLTFATPVLSFKYEPGMLTMTEELRTEAATLPPDRFDKVKNFSIIATRRMTRTSCWPKTSS